MLSQLLAAKFGVEETIAELERAGVPADDARNQLLALGDLQRQIAGAGSATLTSLRGEVVATLTATRALAQQGRAAADAESVGLTLAAASARTRVTVERVTADLFGRRVLDPYLQFDSPEDEAEYGRREAERQEYIRRELAKGTPEGNYNAAQATLAQIDDAGAHGADASPDYGRMRSDTLGAINDHRLAAERDNRPSPQKATITLEEPAPATGNLDEIAAIFRAADVQPPPTDLAQRTGHGLTDLTLERGSTGAARFT